MTSIVRMFWIGLAIITGLTPVLVMAEERIALVVGNGNYGSVSSLDNPTRDAELIAETLIEIGFEVTLLVDSDQIEMKRGIAQFGRQLRKAGSEATGLFYYAGHGVQSFGTNYLVPVDARLEDAADLDLVAIEAQSVLRQMASAGNRTNLVILDACRNNPFVKIADFDDNGLAEMKAPTGTFLAYATEPGGVALDGLDGNSPFTKALVREMTSPGVPVEQVFKQVRVAVLEKTGGQQTPWDASSLTSDFMFVDGISLGADQIAELQLWNSVKSTRDPVQLMLFTRAYPDSPHLTEARTLLAEVMEAELSGAASPGNKPVPPESEGPSPREQEIFELAQTSNSVTAYEAYLAEFPQGVFAEFASGEVAALLAAEVDNGPTAGAETSQSVTASEKSSTVEIQPGAVKYLEPLTVGAPEIIGKTIEQLALGSPLYPPIEGLPDEVWKNKNCGNCHEWTRETLCEQAVYYLGLNAQRSLEKPHPLGGSFKRNLKSWAAGDCQ